MSDCASVLRIIAKDTVSLPKDDREAIVAAADELDMMHYLFRMAHQDLVESNDHLLALRDSVIALRSLHGN